MLPRPLTIISVIMPKLETRYAATYPPMNMPAVMQSFVTRPTWDSPRKRRREISSGGVNPGIPPVQR